MGGGSNRDFDLTVLQESFPYCHSNPHQIKKFETDVLRTSVDSEKTCSPPVTHNVVYNSKKGNVTPI